MAATVERLHGDHAEDAARVATEALETWSWLGFGSTRSTRSGT